MRHQRARVCLVMARLKVHANTIGETTQGTTHDNSVIG